jgi:hypothetical protein
MIDPKNVTDPVLRAQLEALIAENEALKTKKAGTKNLSFKVGAKGALSVYHGSRFPTTLYAQQWEWLLQDKNIALIKQALIDNKDKLSRKAE